MENIHNEKKDQSKINSSQHEVKKPELSLSDRIFELSLSRSFFFPSNEPYGSSAGFYDYGPVGVLIKHKIENLWREIFIKSEGFHEVETSIITPEPILIASGHVGSFADPVAECTKCKTRVRADSLFDEKWDGKLETLDYKISEHKIKCPKCKSDFGKTFLFNLMFKTGIGGEQHPAYSRPETAQGIFTAFARLFKNHGTKLPLAIGQIGKSFRNEISPRKGLIRMREFTQMELEFFFNPSQHSYENYKEIEHDKIKFMVGSHLKELTAKEAVEKSIANNQIMAYFLVRQWQFYKLLGIKEENMYLRVLDAAEVPHYSKGNIDMEVQTSFGAIETIGNAYRTDFDLSAHIKQSGKDLSVFIEEEKKRIVPHVFELSMGVDRLFYCILEQCFRDKSADKDWEWFDFPAVIAPYDVAIFPLMKKDGLEEKSKEIWNHLRKSGLDVSYRDSGSIGRRYARADEIGIPIAATIDYETLKDDSVTLRYRNTGEQIRVKSTEVVTVSKSLIEGKKWDEIKKHYKLVTQEK